MVASCLAAWARGGTSASRDPAFEQDSKALPFVQTAHKPKVPITAISVGTLPSVQVDINRSMKARRALAWDIVQKVWTPVGSPGAQVPAWMTWYEQEDIEPLFREMLAGATRPMTHAQATARVAAVMAKHTEKDLQQSLSSARLGRVLRQFTFPEVVAQLHAKPGTGSIYYNPAYVTHLLANAEQIARYNPAAFQHKAPKAPGTQGEAEVANQPVAANAYALSMDSEMPPDALMIKVDWVPVEQGADSYYTEGKDLAKGFLESPTGNFDLIMVSNKPFTYKIATPQYQERRRAVDCRRRRAGQAVGADGHAHREQGKENVGVDHVHVARAESAELGGGQARVLHAVPERQRALADLAAPSIRHGGRVGFQGERSRAWSRVRSRPRAE